MLGPPVLRVASGEARAQRSRQRLALLEAALPSQGILLLLVFPLLVLLLLFLHLGRRVKESRERGSRGELDWEFGVGRFKVLIHNVD